MIEERYVNFETARLLKEKGFEQDTICVYIGRHLLIKGEGTISNTTDMPIIPAPTQAMAMAWLREKELYIVVKPFDRFDNDLVRFKSIIYTKYEYNDFAFSKDELLGVYSNYNESIEEALKYCLTKLL